MDWNVREKLVFYYIHALRGDKRFANDWLLHYNKIALMSCLNNIQVLIYIFRALFILIVLEQFRLWKIFSSGAKISAAAPVCVVGSLYNRM